MTSSIPPSSVPPVAATASTPPDSSSHGNGNSFATAATTAGVPVAATSSIASAAQVAPIVAAAQAALSNTVNLSAQAQQAVKLEAFAQLVAQLVNHVQPAQIALPSSWPASGVAPQLQQLISALLQQATAGQPLPQQLVSLQSWTSQFTQAVLQHAASTTDKGATTPAAAGLATAGAANTVDGPATARLPAMQNWLVQQGSIQAQDGDRGFTLTLRVPTAWAQAQTALAAALPANSAAASPAATGLGSSLAALSSALQLSFAGSVQQLSSGSMGLVMQPQVLPGSPAAAAAQAMRTSAILSLEFQPLAQAVQSAQVASVYLPAHMLPQDVQGMLQSKATDPWVLMMQNQADENGKKHPKNSNEQANFCNRAGCQYQGRAVCAQPFCAEMNYLWSVDRAQRR